MVRIRIFFSSGSVEIFSTGWRNKGTYVQQLGVEISFLSKDSHDVWSELFFFLTVLLKNTICD